MVKHQRKMYKRTKVKYKYDKLPDKLYQSGKIEIKKSKLHGYGVFATGNFKSGEIVEEGYIVPYVQTVENPHEEQSVITGNFWYLNGWPFTKVELTNIHGVLNVEKSIVTLVCHRDIKKGEELLHYYGAFGINETPQIIIENFNFGRT